MLSAWRMRVAHGAFHIRYKPALIPSAPQLRLIQVAVFACSVQFK